MYYITRCLKNKDILLKSIRTRGGLCKSWRTVKYKNASPRWFQVSFLDFLMQLYPWSLLVYLSPHRRFFSRWTPELQAGATMTPRAAASEIAFLALIMQLILIVLGTIKYKSGSFKNSIHVSRWFKFFRIFLLLVGNFSICNEFGFFFLIIWQSHTPSFAGLLTIRVPSSRYVEKSDKERRKDFWN